MDTMNEYMEQVRDELFFRRNDPHDVRLGEIVKRPPDDHRQADAVIVGCPDDSGVLRNRGRAGARFAPDEIRRALYKFPVSEPLSGISLFDLGNVRIGEALEETHARLHEVVKQLMADGLKVIVLGGGNDISYPDCAALAQQKKGTLVFNIDKHLDIRIDSERTSGTPYRQLIDEKIVDPRDFYEIGTNSFCNSTTYIRDLQKMGAHIHYLEDIRGAGVGKTVRDILKRNGSEAIFWGFDMDVVRSADAPGVSAPDPLGLTASEICEIAEAAAADPRTRVVEITEVNPEYDIDGMTSKLAANIIVRALRRTG